MPFLSESPHFAPPTRKADILIIDDDPTVRASLRLVMKDRYLTREAASTEEALRLFRQTRPAAITLDLCMPQIDGLEALRAIRQIDSSVPVIILTGHASVASTRDAMQLGASDLLEKPFDARLLLDTIESHINRSLPRQTNPPVSAAPDKSAPHHDPFLIWDVLHDIRNPLTVIMLQCDQMKLILNNPDLTPEQKLEHVGTSLAATLKQAQFCGDILSHSKNLGEINRQAPIRINLTHALREVQSDILHLVQERHITLGTRFPSEPVWIHGNPRELRRMLNNVCINAIQAVAPWDGEVHIEAATTKTGIRISVRDNGPGIPTGDLDSIFRPFFTTKGKQGSGLGLHIARFIVQAHRGDITVHNLPGSGCRFDILLPLPSQP